MRTAVTASHADSGASAETVDMKFEVVVIPVVDVDRSKEFYTKLGWRLDADFPFDNGFRVVQFTPPGSGCSVQFGAKITSAPPGSAQGLYLIVSDVAAARKDLVVRGVEVSEVFHPGTPGAQFQIEGSRRISGPAPEHATYNSFATFRDPDGNGWLFQEVTTRLPGRGLSNLDVATLTELLQEAEKHHGEYEPTAPKHHWSGWYAAYIVARQDGKTPEEAAKDGKLRVGGGTDRPMKHFDALNTNVSPIPSSNCLILTPLFLCIEHVRIKSGMRRKVATNMCGRLIGISLQMAVLRDSLGALKGFVEMATYVQTVDIGHFAPADEREALTREALTREVRRGLIARPRSLSPWMFYDAEGSRLFERITTLPEYYPTRTERAILAGYADAIIAAAHDDRSLPLRLVELGAGTASKTCILLEAALRVSDDVTYVPVDVCPNALESACQNFAGALPEVRIQPVVRNYVTHPLQLDLFDGTTLALYIGTSIGNFSPEEARLILRHLRSQLQTGDALFLGTDMVKDESTLLAAYDDSDGITAAFNLNILHRLNRELGANFDADCFRHRVLWNSIESRIEMHLESTQEQHISIERADFDLHLIPRETIHTENSYKFTDQGIRTLLGEVGFEIRGSWKDSRGWYTLTLACLQ